MNQQPTDALAAAQEQIFPPHGLKGPVVQEEFFTPELVLLFTACALALIGVAWLLLLWKRRRRKIKSVQPRSSWETLVERINCLEPPDQTSEQSTHIELTYSSNVNLLARELVASLTSQPCEDWTTEEFFAAFKTAWPLESVMTREAVTALLTETDSVRFAGKPLSREAATNWRQNIQEWVRRAEAFKAQALAQEVPSSKGQNVHG